MLYGKLMLQTSGNTRFDISPVLTATGNTAILIRDIQGGHYTVPSISLTFQAAQAIFVDPAALPIQTQILHL